LVIHDFACSVFKYGKAEKGIRWELEISREVNNSLAMSLVINRKY
jgi:hypothetical protein